MCPNKPMLPINHGIWSRLRIAVSLSQNRENRSLRWFTIIVIAAVAFGLFQLPVYAKKIEVISEETAETSKEAAAGQSRKIEISDPEITVTDEDGEIHRIQIDADWDNIGRRPNYDRSRTEEDDIISVGHDIHVEEDEYIEGNVVCILGTARIDGIVDGEVVAIGGSVILSPGAIVYGQAVSVGGGNVVVPDRAVVHGEAVSVGGRIRDEEGSLIGERIEITFLPSFGSDYGFVGFGWIIFIAHILLVGICCLIILKIQRVRWAVAVMTLKERGWESLLAGVGGGIIYSIILLPLMLVLAIALIAIVVGIPLIPVIILLLLLFPIPGYMITSILLGYTFIGLPVEQRAGEGDSAREYAHFDSSGMSKAFWMGHCLVSIPTLAALMLMAFNVSFQIPLIFWILGGAVINLVLTLGWGAFLLSRFGRRPPPYVSVS